MGGGAAILALVLVARITFPVLELAAPKTGKVILSRMISPETTFALGFRHSVELSFVWDLFRPDGEDRLVLYETRFHSSNAGLPSSLAEGEAIHLEKDILRITGRRQRIASLHFWVNSESENTLIINGKETYLLAELAGDGLLELSLRRTDIFSYGALKFKSLLQ